MTLRRFLPPNSKLFFLEKSMGYIPHDNTVLAYISKIVQNRVLVTIIHIYRKSYMEFTVFFDLEWPWKVNPGHTGFQWPVSPNLFKITTELLLLMDRKSYEVLFGAIVLNSFLLIFTKNFSRRPQEIGPWAIYIAQGYILGWKMFFF